MLNSEKQTKQPFAEKHPKLNLFLGFCLLIGIICISVFVLVKIFSFLGTSFTKLLEAASNLDAVVIVALITGGVSLISVVFSSIIGKYWEYNRNRQLYLSQKREEAYKQFIYMVYRIQENINVPDSYSSEEMLDDVRSFSKDLTLWGSPKVVNKWIDFRQKSLENNSSPDNMYILEDIMNKMRKDMGCKKVKKGNLLSFFINDIKNSK